MHIPYEAAGRLLQELSPRDSKFARSVRGRRAATNRWIAWGRSRDSTRLVAWVHGASVGEALAIRPIVARLRRARPQLEVVHSYTSASAVGWADLVPADRSDFFPQDSEACMSAVFDAVRPSIVLIARGDVWPHFMNAAARRRVPVVVVGGTVSPRSRRLRWPVRPILTPIHRQIDRVCAISEDDAERWRTLGVPDDRVVVTGDPRDDDILESVTEIAALSPLISWRAGRWVLAAGSTDRLDAVLVLDGLRALRESHPEAAAVIVPHDPTESAIAQLTDHAATQNLTATTWHGSGPIEAADVVIVGVRGLLASLYALADTAYVGGGFRRGGQHCIAEPASLAVPTVVGPLAGDTPEGARFVGCGSVEPLPTEEPASALATHCRRWLDIPGEAWTRGLAARAVLRHGAADSCCREALAHLGEIGGLSSTDFPA